jgi:DNA invertase Pin-like site-specific DNA recombinase
MSEMSKITQDHVRRSAIVYVRQSSTTQVENNRESTARQYQLAERAVYRASIKLVVSRQSS